ncbi:MAG: hypothetical protein GWP17_00950 [Aquificales bacterium]|nr:hypothetical protein [Aquificales bacterium]
MQFYPDDAPVPEILHTADFVIRPLTPAHVELDYAALMGSQEMLRLWSGSSWPSNDFSLADNRKDLAWHWHEHQQRIAFTYTVLNPAEDTCLGCIYIKPITDILADNEEWGTACTEPFGRLKTGSVEAPVLSNAEVAVSDSPTALIRFWAAQPYLSQKLDKALLITLQQWFAAKWAFSDIYWHTRTENQQQIALFQANGLQKHSLVHMPGRGGEHFLFTITSIFCTA